MRFAFRGACDVFERAKVFMKAKFPRAASAYRRVAGKRRAGRFTNARAEEVFTEIYRANSWKNAESASGRGSTLERTRVIRAALPELLRETRANSLFDAACGDFNWMREINLRGIAYTGADVVRQLVERNQTLYGCEGRAFLFLDITRDQLPAADAILCRDCFIHLSFRDIRASVANFKRSGATFLLATTHASVAENIDITTGDWRSVNLLLPPFNFPAPQRLVEEDAESGKSLGVWRLEELP